jgi:hypothetical protein
MARFPTIVLALLGAIVLSAGSCGPKPCESNEECGEGRVCTDTGTCQVISCGSSLDCPIQSWCDSSTGQCTAGCLNDRDCLPTQACDQERRECFEPGCRSTALDCEFGQFCNSTSGQCLDAGDVYCRECQNSEDCDSINNWCVTMPGSSSTYCAVDCSNGSECPRGYTCVRIRGPGDVTMGYGCIAPCWEGQ